MGNPASDYRVLLSTVIPEVWVIDEVRACDENSPANCSATRGGTFLPSASTTWSDQGGWSLGEEIALGVSPGDGGDYGFDTVGLNVAGAAALILDHQVVVASIAPASDFYLGYLGVAPRTPSFNTSTQTSLLQSLKNQNHIPSLSYGYSAGAYYREWLGSIYRHDILINYRKSDRQSDIWWL